MGMVNLTERVGKLKNKSIYAAGVALLMSAVLVQFFRRDGLIGLHLAKSRQSHPGSGSESVPPDISRERDDLDPTIDPSLRQRILEGRRAHERARSAAGDGRKVLGGPEFATFDDEGLVSRSLVDLAGIDIARREELDDLVAQLRNTISSSMESRAAHLQDEPRGQGSARIFKVEGSPEAAGEFKKTMEGEIAAKFGTGAARVLLPYLTKPEYLGGAGNYSIKLEFVTNPLKKGAFGNVRYYVTDPVTGADIVQGSIGNAEVYDRHFGNLLAGKAIKDFWDGTPKSE